MVPTYLRRANKLAGRRKDVGAVVYTAVLALRYLWRLHELRGVPPHPDCTNTRSCACRSCDAIHRRALRELGVSNEMWNHLSERKTADAMEGSSDAR